jgi:hypothetical protein
MRPRGSSSSISTGATLTPARISSLTRVGDDLVDINFPTQLFPPPLAFGRCQPFAANAWARHYRVKTVVTARKKG